MNRQLAMIGAAVMLGCSGTTTSARLDKPPQAEDEPAGCPSRFTRDAVTPVFSPPLYDDPEPAFGKRIGAIEIFGLRRISDALIRGALESRVGDALDEQVLAEDVKRLYRLEALSDVSISTTAQADALTLEVRVRERERVGTVQVFGVDPVQQRTLGIESGQLYEADRLTRRMQELVDQMKSDGHLDATARARAASTPDAVDVCIEIHPGAQFRIGQLVFAGNAQLTDEELLSEMQFSGEGYNRPDKPFRRDLLEGDVLRMQALYYDRGMLDSSIRPAEVERRGQVLTVTLAIEEGQVFSLGRVELSNNFPGGAAPYTQALAKLVPGSVFSRSNMTEVVAELSDLASKQGKGEFSVLPELDLERDTHVVHLRLDAHIAPPPAH